MPTPGDPAPRVAGALVPRDRRRARALAVPPSRRSSSAHAGRSPRSSASRPAPTPVSRASQGVRCRRAADGAKTLFEGGAAAKVAAVAVAASGDGGRRVGAAAPDAGQAARAEVGRRSEGPPAGEAVAPTTARGEPARSEAKKIKSVSPKTVPRSRLRPKPAAAHPDTRRLSRVRPPKRELRPRPRTPLPGRRRHRPRPVEEGGPPSPEHAQGRDKPKPKDVEAAPPEKAAEPPKAQPDLPARGPGARAAPRSRGAPRRAGQSSNPEASCALSTVHNPRRERKPHDATRGAPSSRSRRGRSSAVEREAEVVDAFLERIDQRLANRADANEKALNGSRDHQREMILGSMGISIPLCSAIRRDLHGACGRDRGLHGAPPVIAIVVSRSE